jgi:serine/alanine adding enzyme
MTFRVLRADGPDRSRWDAILSRLPAELRDLHYLPEYGLIYRDTYGYEPMLAVLERDAAVVVHAFVRRPLNSLSFLSHAGGGEAFYDIATPYGFGGPLVAGVSGAAAIESLRCFDTAFREWCRSERLASEFCCLHPVLGNQALVAASGIVTTRPAKEVVIVDLDAAEATLWARISRGTRSSIQRSRREGVRVERVQPDAATLELFGQLYDETMRRREAAPRWFFPPEYFPSCVSRLGPERSALFFARCQGEVAAAYLLLNDARTAYYHFGASDVRWLDRRPNNLLMYETLLWAKRRGLSAYHLGGGVTASENDSLLRFKSSYGGRREVLYTSCRVLDEEVYRDLCERKLRHETLTTEPVANRDYFPLYRR